jgi:uncharacterized protein YegL
MKSRKNWYISLVFIVALGFGLVFQGTFQSAMAGGSWFSKARQVTQIPTEFPATRAAGDIGTTVFDMVISLYNDPTGDDDPDNDTGTEEQTDYEEIIRFWADAIYEQSNGALQLGKVRIFRNGIYGALADVVWNASAHPSGAPSGFGISGQHITFGDLFGGTDFLVDHEEGGYTLGHEFGHYVFGLYDEYRGSVATHSAIYWPLSGDTPVQDSIMHNQFNAVTDTGNNFDWLNHSTSDNYEANTGQGRAYGASGWEVLIREVADDPKDGARSTLAQRVRYTALVGQQPTAADGWMVLELPGEQDDARDELEIIWMQDDIEMQIVIDRSISMMGDPFANAKEAAKALVDEVENGSTALGVVSFDTNATQDQAITAIPDPPGTVKDDIKTLITNLKIGEFTAMFDAADLALDNLISYATTNGTNATQLVFLLSDGEDNESTETQASVTAAYQAADVALNTFAYGTFAPEGVLRELARDTGGLFRVSPTDLAEIQSAFLATKAALTSSAGILQESASIPSGGSHNFTFAVDGTLRELSIFANHAGSSGDVGFSLAGPGGPVSGVSFTCTEVSGVTSCSAAVDESTVTAAGTGGWTLTAANSTGSAVDVNVDILATPQPVRVYDLVVGSLGGTEITYPNPILLTATPSQDLPITGVSISASITDPLGTVAPLTLVDTGQNGDGIAGDGTYSAIVDYEMNGNYLIKVKVDNAGQTAQYTMEGFAPVHYPSIGENGEMPPLPVFPPITENFTRTASIQLVVSGLVSDDHPDSAPGTTVQPDNSEVPGRIETAGDVDVFTVPTKELDYLVFRVTGLASGMNPRLRILAADGTTEIFNATIGDLAVAASYLALNIPVGVNAQLHAEVSHASGGTGTYQVSVGKAIGSDPHPVADAGPDQIVECTTPEATPVMLDGTGSFDAKGELPVSYFWSNSFGTAIGPTPTVQLPLWSETITLVVNDGQLDSDPDTVDITVEDTTAPVIETLVANPSMLWPPNHKLVDVVLTLTVTDVCDPNHTCSIVDIHSNEPPNGLGDGDKYPDWIITGNFTAKLRAERSGTGTGRVYTIFVECIDASGNMSTGNVTVTVPHEQ